MINWWIPSFDVSKGKATGESFPFKMWRLSGPNFEVANSSGFRQNKQNLCEALMTVIPFWPNLDAKEHKKCLIVCNTHNGLLEYLFQKLGINFLNRFCCYWEITTCKWPNMCILWLLAPRLKRSRCPRFLNLQQNFVVLLHSSVLLSNFLITTSGNGNVGDALYGLFKNTSRSSFHWNWLILARK